jgi:hypothetical protein
VSSESRRKRALEAWRQRVGPAGAVVLQRGSRGRAKLYMVGVTKVVDARKLPYRRSRHGVDLIKLKHASNGRFDPDQRYVPGGRRFVAQNMSRLSWDDAIKQAA